MILKDHALKVEFAKESLISHFRNALESSLTPSDVPIRFLVNKMDNDSFHCELATLQNAYHDHVPPSIFTFRKRRYENNNQFNAVLLIPTGIDCEIGGHAGDATPTARLLASLCDNLIIHPNVVNASDINELTDNCLVLEGSVLSRFLMGTIALQKVRANQMLVVLEEMANLQMTEAAINSVSAARATLGINCVEIIRVEKPCRASISFSDSGRASGKIEDLDKLLEILIAKQDSYDAVALITALETEQGHEKLMYDYYMRNSINPWGGIEAMFSHSISSYINKPAMHAPMMEAEVPLDYGLVDPRKAAEVVSRTYMHCVLKGLHRSPKIIQDESIFTSKGLLTVEDVHCLIIPESVLGLPVLAAIEQAIPIIAVRENRNLMRNNLERLGIEQGRYFLVDNYLEAAGLMAAIKAGVDASATKRPMRQLKAEQYHALKSPFA